MQRWIRPSVSLGNRRVCSEKKNPVSQNVSQKQKLAPSFSERKTSKSEDEV